MARLRNTYNKRDKYRVTRETKDEEGNVVIQEKIYPSTRAIVEDYPQFTSHSVYDFCRGRVTQRQKQCRERYSGFHFEKLAKQI